MAYPMNAIRDTVEILLRTDARKAIKYLSDKQVVCATRRLYKGKIVKRGNVEITLTLGRPNYEERQYIRWCKRAGEKFPLKKIQLKYPPRKH